MPRIFFALLILISLLLPASALTLTISGGCVGEKVTVTTDENAVIIFRMNSGTPIFSEASLSNPAYFKPMVEGELLVTAIAADETVSKTIQIKNCRSGGFVEREELNKFSLTELLKFLEERLNGEQHTER